MRSVRKNDVDKNATPSTTAKVVREYRSFCRLMLRRVRRNTGSVAQVLDAIQDGISGWVTHFRDDLTIG